MHQLDKYSTTVHEASLKMHLSQMQWYISSLLPQHKKKHCAAVGTDALVVHFAYFTQENDLLRNAPGLLDQYTRRAHTNWPSSCHSKHCTSYAPGAPHLFA